MTDMAEIRNPNELARLRFVVGALTKLQGKEGYDFSLLCLEDGKAYATDGKRMHYTKLSDAPMDGFYAVLHDTKALLLKHVGTQRGYPTPGKLIPQEEPRRTVITREHLELPDNKMSTQKLAKGYKLGLLLARLYSITGLAFNAEYIASLLDLELYLPWKVSIWPNEKKLQPILIETGETGALIMPIWIIKQEEGLWLT